MSVITTILGVLVAIEFFYITYLETVKTTSDATARVFKNDQRGFTKQKRPSTV